MKLDLNAPLPSAVMVVLISLVLGWVLYWPMPQGKAMRNIETELVRIKLSGVNFDIPVNYMYSEAMEVYGYWPKIKDERVEVEALTLSVLLPDFRPYNPKDDSYWKMRGHGDRVQFTINGKNPSSDWYGIFYSLTISAVSSGSTTLGPDAYGLRAFKDPTGTITYFPRDANRKITISCVSPDRVPSPGCSVKTNFRGDITLEYSFGLNHLSSWEEIDTGLKNLLSSFSGAR